MDKIRYDAFKNGTKHCITFSYDDGKNEDIRLAELFKKYGMKATFNLNSSKIGVNTFLSAKDVKKLSDEGFEIAVHSVTHPFLEELSEEHIVAEILDDRKALEEITGKLVTGMAYPFGTFNESVKCIAKACGINYSRTTVSGVVLPPKDWLEWGATCHHKDFAQYAIQDFKWNWKILYIWGHSYEFDTEEKWAEFENCLKQIAGRTDVWYATNGEIYEYITAQRNLKWSTDFKKVYNPSCIPVWVKINEKPIKLEPGLNELK